MNNIVGHVTVIAGGPRVVAVGPSTDPVTTLGDPGADRLYFWDDSANKVGLLEPESTITITGTKFGVTPNTFQPVDATLTALAGQAVAADKLIYATGDDTFAITGFTAAARSVLDDATVGDMVNTLFGAASVGTGGAARATSPIFGTGVGIDNIFVINGDNSNPASTTNGGQVCIVTAAGTNGAGATAGKDGRNYIIRTGAGGTSGSGVGGNGGNFLIGLGVGGAGGGGNGSAGGFSVSVNGVPLFTILGSTTDVFVGENSQNVYIGGSNSGGGTNASINIGQAGCDAINLGNAGGNCFVNVLGHFQMGDDYNNGVELIDPGAIMPSATARGGFAVYQGGNLIGYVPIFAVA